MFKNIHELDNYIAEHQIEFVDLYYTDLFGGFRHLSAPANEINELVNEGLAFDGSSVPGFHSVESGDLLLLPDPSTAFVDPFSEKNVIMLCRQVDAITRIGNPADPRTIAEKAAKHLNDELNATSLWLPEIEFFIFNRIDFNTTDFESFYSLYTNEFICDEESIGNISTRKDGYHTTPPRDSHFELRANMCRTLKNIGIPVHYHHHEVAGAAQQEIEIKPTSLLKAADAVQIMKYVIRMSAFKENKSACFLPKPIHNHAGSGMHFHQMLVKDGLSMFYEKGQYADLSDLALHYIGGLLHHAPALIAFTNPSTNSFKRLLPGFEAPTKIFFGLANRSAAIRIPKYTNKPTDKRFEFRPPDATCNPYLAISAMLMAGLDGIRNKIDPTRQGFGPFDEDITKWQDSKKNKLKSIPANLEEALVALSKDKKFLTAGNVFTDEFINNWIRLKTKELNEIAEWPNPIEFTKYHNL